MRVSMSERVCLESLFVLKKARYKTLYYYIIFDIAGLCLFMFLLRASIHDSKKPENMIIFENEGFLVLEKTLACYKRHFKPCINKQTNRQELLYLSTKIMLQFFFKCAIKPIL